MTYLSPLLNKEFQKVFDEFSQWLVARRGINYTAIKIGYYFKFLHELNNLTNRLNTFPTYKDIVNSLTVARTRQFLLVTIFLSESGVIEIDSKIKDEFSNLDMIDRYLNYFEQDSEFSKLINDYYDMLQLKLEDGKTSIRSIRLALTPAMNFLKNCVHFGFSQPSQDVLRGFLWASPGQRAAITGFINFLRCAYDINITLASIPKKVTFKRPYLSTKTLKQRFIDIIREHQVRKVPDEQLLRTCIAYLHGIDPPIFVKLSCYEIMKGKDGEYYLRLANERFYLPKQSLLFL